MNDVLIYILFAPVVLLAYGSGLLLWPIRRWLRRRAHQLIQARSLKLAFFLQLCSYFAVAACSLTIHIKHFYGWFALLILLNLVFTIAGAVCWLRDNRYDSNLDLKNMI